MDGKAGKFVPSVESLRFELDGRLRDIEAEVGKTHLSLRWESMSKIARVGVCIENYDWDTRGLLVDRLAQFQQDHLDDFALEFDVIPLEAVRDEEFAEA
ncbi:hypothetical protein GR168_02685 [Gordonia sp. JH63]|uniref:hypothetical protein n=1 Tax=Gordonia sp. JH63 TaxID=2698900 RepID=UPI00132040DF|nr:hypothetical protein [Gordonia sp. JH63]QHD84419.1 hypothetical protein GR168_02685 [Gordonia sp. JH63]